MDLAFASAPIVKSEPQNDGTVYVTGRVADSGLDHDQQICDPAWLDRAVPTWMTEGANIRGQHNAHDAVGVGLVHQRERDVRDRLLPGQYFAGPADRRYDGGAVVGPAFFRRWS